MTIHNTRLQYTNHAMCLPLAAECVSTTARPEGGAQTHPQDYSENYPETFENILPVIQHLSLDFQNTSLPYVPRQLASSSRI